MFQHRRIYECIAVFLICCTCLFAGFVGGEIWGESTDDYNRGWNVGYGSGYNRCQWDFILDNNVNPADLRPHIVVEDRTHRPTVCEFINHPDTSLPIIHAVAKNRADSESYAHK